MTRVRDGTGRTAQFASPGGLAVDPRNGIIYVSNGDKICKITPNDWVVTTLAGQDNQYGLRDGTGTGVLFDAAAGLAVDRHGRLFAADYNNNLLRMITPDGVVSSIPFQFIDGTALEYPGLKPRTVAIDASGNMYVTKSDDTEPIISQIFKLTPVN